MVDPAVKTSDLTTSCTNQGARSLPTRIRSEIEARGFDAREPPGTKRPHEVHRSFPTTIQKQIFGHAERYEIVVETILM